MASLVSSSSSFLFFSHLPVDIFRLIFEYLTLPAISRLDCAFTNHQTRSLYLTALAGVSLPELTTLPCSSLLLHWLQKRRILIHTLIIAEYDHNTTQLVQQNISTLCSVKLLNATTPDSRAYFQPISPIPNTSAPSSPSPSPSAPADDLFSLLSSAPHLTILSLEDCQMITQGHISLLLTGIAQYKTLLLSNCSRLINEVVTLIAQSPSCRQLEHLGIGSLSFLSPQDLQLLTVSCRAITRLDISKGDRALSDDVVPLLLDAYPHLQELTLFNCINISLRMKARVLSAISAPQLSSASPDLQLLGARSLRKALSDGTLSLSTS
jgi:hypothetical protein